MSIESRSYDPDDYRVERHIAAMEDGSGFSNYLAEARESEDSIPATSEVPRVKTPGHKPHRSGHVYDFESDRDHQLAQERAEYRPPNPEQAAINARGRAAVDAALDETFGKDRHIQAIIDAVHRDIPIDPDRVEESKVARDRMVNARLRTYFDRKQNRSA